MKQQNEKQRVNKPSTLLSQEENENVFSLLGRRCQTMSTAVVQLFTTDAPAHSAWIKRLSGVACFVRDSSKRSYYIRVYCLARYELVWEEEMYESILVNKPREFLICFEGQECMVALSFASDAEANVFYKTTTTTVSNRSKRRQDRRSRKFSPAKTETSQDNGYDSGVVLRSQPATGLQQFTQMPQTNRFGLGVGRDKKTNKPNRKLTKADISTPTNFKHLAHVGWDNQKCFELNSEEVSNLDMFLKKAGVSEQQLNDRDTRAYIYDFIRDQNVLDLVKSETSPHTPPPVPSRNQRTAPPPPPAANNVSRPPAQLPSKKPSRPGPPGRPPPIEAKIAQPSISPTESNSSVAPPPPPPPPPMPPPISTMPSMNAQANTNHSNSTIAPPAPVMDVRSALMDSIRKGTTLRKVDPATLSTGSGDARSDLMNEIQKGIELRPVADREISDSRDSYGKGGTDALADALRKALEKRCRDLQGSSDDDDDSTDNDEWD